MCLAPSSAPPSDRVSERKLARECVCALEPGGAGPAEAYQQPGTKTRVCDDGGVLTPCKSNRLQLLEPLMVEALVGGDSFCPTCLIDGALQTLVLDSLQ